MTFKPFFIALSLIGIMAFTDPVAPPATGMSAVSAAEIHELGLSNIPQVVFWRRIMHLHKDSCLVNVHNNRTILATWHAPTWHGYGAEEKGKILDSFKRLNGITDSPRIVGTMGKSFFYDFEKVAPNIPLGVQEFENNGVDGWYAKAILLIESPNQLQKSTAGAYGPFQLMKGVALNYGLKVNKKIDERANFNRSAYAASQLIKSICIPYTKQMLDAKAITYNEKDLWFRLLVMHVYNAGAGNVKLALDAIPVPALGMGLIQQLWITSAGRFQTASQNYSQLILAAFLEYEARIEKKTN